MQRPDFISRIKAAFEVTPIVALLGPRQCGKTTLAKQYVSSVNSPDINYFDLEDPDDLARLEHPKLTLSGLKNLITLDEIQRLPEIFPLLRVMVDNKKLEQKYLILGSASRELLQQTSETLAGRISYIELTPFSMVEVNNLQQLWLRGGFPLSYLAHTDEVSYSWRKEYIRTFLERDMQMMGINVSPENLRRFWMMLVHYHGNIFNASEIGRSLNISHPTAKNYLDILTHTFMIRELKPWFENISKRQVKSSKIYFRDTGIMHSLIGIKDESDLKLSTKLGASWEGFALEETIRHIAPDPLDCYFWATQADAELDLLILKDGKKLGFEFKYSDLPKVTKSMHIALSDLHLEQLVVIYPGDKQYQPHEKIFVCGLETFLRNGNHF
ncbi:MAG: ATP-binding protein [Proteobacteria bacterium]|nr:ATP-binding protein [Pseudomonadota bacterium]